jgi:hypothetical protein
MCISGACSSRVSSQQHTLCDAGTARSKALSSVVLPDMGRPDTNTPVDGWRITAHSQFAAAGLSVSHAARSWSDSQRMR